MGCTGVKIMDLSIGQMARINHISIQTLRLYDKMGLLKPVAVDAGSGYRYYSILQCAKLDLIGSPEAVRPQPERDRVIL